VASAYVRLTAYLPHYTELRRDDRCSLQMRELFEQYNANVSVRNFAVVYGP